LQTDDLQTDEKWISKEEIMTQVQASELTLLSGVESFMNDLSENDEAMVNGGRRGSRTGGGRTSGRTRTRTRTGR
jgi:hypothetical protein